ncbi:ferredoxin [Streptomyces marianii]|uniref:Ferredoxin n=1 Tax=Streptomyces marianii TaxID=1817406 RepID=A0A5R9ECE9_9ACTN|nr:ferredoxin [Streptomyces marianii]TLQ47870.1 ferredoxin [Streptomyces marianii]
MSATGPVKVNRERCVGAGNCVRVAPELFDQDDDGVVRLVPGEDARGYAPEAVEAADLCPAAAIEYLGE